MLKGRHVFLLLLILGLQSCSSGGNSGNTEGYIDDNTLAEEDFSEDDEGMVDNDLEDGAGEAASDEIDKEMYPPLIIPWGVKYNSGKKFRIYFYDGTDMTRRMVFISASEWTKYGNFSFQPTSNIDRADIKIKFDLDEEHGSCIGREAEGKNLTMVLPTYEQVRSDIFNAIVLHEFGHALGLAHEHSHPDANLELDSAFIYTYFIERLGSKIGKKRSNDVLKQFLTEEVETTEYDPLSIMHYKFPKGFLKNGVEIPENYTLSAKDKLNIKKLYP